jgi:copper chaperone
MEVLELQVDRMSCGHCVIRVTDALKKLPGVQLKNVAIGRVTLSHDSSTTSELEIRAALANAGYPVSSVSKAA